MTANLKVQQKTELKRQRAWELHINGADQWSIASELGVTQGRVCQLIKEAAKNNPIVQLSYEERAACLKPNGIRSNMKSAKRFRSSGAMAASCVRSSAFLMARSR